MGGPGWGWMEGQGQLPRKTVIWHWKDKWEFGEVRTLGSRGKGAACPKAQKDVSVKERGTWIRFPWMTCRLREELLWGRRFKFFTEAWLKKKTAFIGQVGNLIFVLKRAETRCRFINRGMIFSNLYFRNFILLSTNWKCTGEDNAGGRRAVRKLMVGTSRKTRESPDRRSGEKGDANNTKKVEQV